MKVTKDQAGFETLREIVKNLRGEKGCPWDKQQTPQTLKKYLIEETYELIEAIEKEKDEEVREELGDLLFLLIFILYLYEEKGVFSYKDLFYYTAQKMIKRHPHVFGDEVAKTAEEVLKHWQRVKKEEGKSSSVLGNIPKSLPALQRAFRLGERAARVGFDWEAPEEVLNKLKEETEELKEAIKKGDQEALKEEIGDLLFTVANLSRKLNINPEEALKVALEKFETRFKRLEQEVEKRGLSWEELSLTQLDQIWEEIKNSL
ncbi:nucleoside triphosphate pyrophosphohydrolase [Thermodesulfobacterium sp. TA1]|uniref:nucleoside triphosphate pyrophosphohydrolase n=1 Tax=Thermodesulfobacterium sp. TA1 TaxID=2234087 RepID=UPI001231FFC5|nr:nucleoside triphosphate pyrophosphohydrolase [Thermodesulfobacterium sp. TA1]QER42327.1 nucleoside triphosphate pyrophosphohydrolase [Thermodesulfobacterium sp. TA1]